jgi:hypothetical protein
MRHVANEHDGAWLFDEEIYGPARRIVWLKTTRGRAFGQGLARAAKQFSSLPGA